jgi:predicted transcriptional regulator of viral defense system
MKKLTAIQTLRQLDQKGKYVFTKHDFTKLFANDKLKALAESLNRLVKAGLIERACRGIYVNRYAKSFDSYTIEHIAKALRRNEYNYVSLESILSEYGVISQIPLDRLTVMTTGRKGIHKTRYGIIEFTHTKRSVSDILDHIKTIKERPLRIASKETALRDLKRIGRNLHLLQKENIDNE